MSHPLKDVLFIRKTEQFYITHWGSPACELNTLIESPKLELISSLLILVENWDYIFIDINFNFNEIFDFIINNADIYMYKDKIMIINLNEKSCVDIKERWCH